MRKHRLFVKFKHEYTQGLNLNKDIKIYYPFMKAGVEDVDGLIRRVVNKYAGKYLLAWLFNDSSGGFAPVIRAWDDKGYELHTQDLVRLNQNRKNKIERGKRK